MDTNDRIHKIVQTMNRMMDAQASADALQEEVNERLSNTIRRLTICVAILGTMVAILAVRIAVL